MNTLSEIYQKLSSVDYHISTDTREFVSGSMFFAWKGGLVDGNDYVSEALEKGAAFVVMDNPEKTIDDARCLLVDEAMKMLQDLAHYHRMQFTIPVIGLTGSNGKTTTKELLAGVLETEKNIVATTGNLNNHVGVPKTLLQIRPETEIAIIEMGANHVGEIAGLCRIAHPTHGLITNIGRAHIGLFGGYENIIRAKTELYRYLEKSGGMSFVDGTDALLLRESNTESKITYGSAQSDYPVTSNNTMPLVSVNWNNHNIQTQLTGEYNISNIAAAIGVAGYFAVPDEYIVQAIEAYWPNNQRSEIVETKNGNTIIKDYYNANRSSMELALENLAAIQTDKPKIVILGDMFELGDYEMEDHIAVAELTTEFDEVYLVGNAFSQVPLELDHVQTFETTNEVISALQKSPTEDSYILLKASQGMNFEKLFNEVRL